MVAIKVVEPATVVLVSIVVVVMLVSVTVSRVVVVSVDTVSVSVAWAADVSGPDWHHEFNDLQ